LAFLTSYFEGLGEDFVEQIPVPPGGAHSASVGGGCAHELEAAQASVLHECGHTAVAEQELATSRSALGAEQAALGVERAA
jgi:hypothetical protein